MNVLVDVAFLLIAAGFLLALLLHAITTLRGMREKLIYPLLRVKTPDGSLRSVVRVRASRHGGTHIHLACAM